jgi:hypothetical protein
MDGSAVAAAARVFGSVLVPVDLPVPWSTFAIVLQRAAALPYQLL